MKKIIKIKEGDVVPSGATFLYAKEVKEKVGEFTEYGFLYNTVYTQYKKVTYFYYEVEVE